MGGSHVRRLSEGRHGHTHRGGRMGRRPDKVPRVVRSKMVHLEPREILAVLKAARRRSARDWAMILVAYRHGLRASEVCDLRLAEVNLKNRQASIRRLKGSLSPTVQPIERHRGQPLLDELRAVTSWLRERRDDGSEFLFLSQKGGRLGRSQFFRDLQGVRRGGRPAREEMPSARAEALASYASDLREREFGLGKAVSRSQGDRVNHEVRRGRGQPGGRGGAGCANENILKFPKPVLLKHDWRPESISDLRPTSLSSNSPRLRSLHMGSTRAPWREQRQIRQS